MTVATLESGPARSGEPYRSAAIWLHWAVAALIIAELAIGWFMNHAMVDHSPPQEAMEGFHVSLGFTVLAVILVRIGVRLANPAPPLPPAMPRWERRLAHAVHALFYVLMLALPLTGWALVSTHRGPVEFWGLAVPRLVGFAPALPGHSRAVGVALKAVHNEWLPWITVGNLALHVAGALKHQFDGHPVLWRMAPLTRRSRPDPSHRAEGAQ
jgi:cytochrome b561